LLSLTVSEPPSIAQKAGSFQHAVEYLHPSEDGEALQFCSIPRAVTDQSRTVLDDGSCWFAMYTTSRHEKTVAKHLTQRGIEHYLPLYWSERQWRDGSRVNVELPLFPSYVFVRFSRPERTTVVSVPGVLGLVNGAGGGAAIIAEHAIDALRAGIRERRITPHQQLRIGERARIRRGAFAGMQGVVVRRKGSCRIVLTLEQIMQSVAVEVNEDDLDCVSQAEVSTSNVCDPVNSFELQPSF
jgi:transcription antitermination factor NusG